ncbi:MAG: dihydrodipicolinate synthase family protein [Gammaproteobacteria bacterium]|nr:dihydrodipicolinate synthase family protein [Gammaproteobacteria bacterium]
MMKHTAKDLQSLIRGPVFPILTPFTEKTFEVDHEALRRYVEFLIGEGANNILVTVGTSRFNLLSIEEMKSVNKTVVHAVNERAIAIVAGPQEGSLHQNLEFANHAAEIGADGLIVMYPERFYGDQAIFGFYKEISERSEVPILIHEMPMRDGFGGPPVQYSLDLLDRLTDLSNIGGIKEECMQPAYTYRILRKIAEKTAIIGAGSMRNYLRDCHAGANAYLVGIGSFLPKLALEFYQFIGDQDFVAAENIVRNNEDPYFDFAVSLGWHRALKQTLNAMGLMPGIERPPLLGLDEEERIRLSEVLSKLGWLNKGVQ